MSACLLWARCVADHGREGRFHGPCLQQQAAHALTKPNEIRQEALRHKPRIAHLRDAKEIKLALQRISTGLRGSCAQDLLDRSSLKADL